MIKPLFIKRLLFIPFGLIAYFVTLYAQYNPTWTEQVYSQNIYPMLSSMVAFLPSLVGFSVAEWFVLAFILFCLGYIIYYIREFILCKKTPSENATSPHEQGTLVVSDEADGVTRQNEQGLADSPDVIDDTTHKDKRSLIVYPTHKDKRSLIVYRGVMGLVALFCVVYFVYASLCGLNYYRSTFTQHSGLEIQESSVEELEQLCRSLASEMGSLRTQLGENTDLSAPAQGDFDYYAQQSVQAYQRLSEKYPVLYRALYSPPKPVLASELMSYSGIGGIFFPWTMESNVNAHTPFFTVPSTMAHELAHQCGFMREDEANFIAYLACKESDEELMQYSGYLLAFTYSISALSRSDSELAQEIASGLPESVRYDMMQRSEYWAEHEGLITDISNDINDLYLKSNNQADGVQSYGRMVDLLLAEQRSEG